MMLAVLDLFFFVSIRSCELEDEERPGRAQNVFIFFENILKYG